MYSQFNFHPESRFVKKLHICHYLWGWLQKHSKICYKVYYNNLTCYNN